MFYRYLIILVFLLEGGFALAQGTDSLKNSVSLANKYTVVEGIENWNTIQLRYSRAWSGFTALSGIRYSRRYGESGTYLSFSGYPVFSTKSYGYVNVGFSPDDSSIYPNLRLSAAYYHNITPQMVGGSGIQYINLPGGDLYIANLYINYYFGKYLLMVRPSYLMETSKNTFSGMISLRRYFKGSESFFEILAGSGRSIENLLLEESFRETYLSRIVGVKVNHRLTREWSVIGSLTYSKNDFSNGTERNQIGVHFGVKVHF